MGSVDNKAVADKDAAAGNRVAAAGDKIVADKVALAVVGRE